MTLIPLNKIHVFKISAEVLAMAHLLQATDDHVRNLTCLQKPQVAKYLAPCKVGPALLLVSYLVQNI